MKVAIFVCGAFFLFFLNKNIVSKSIHVNVYKNTKFNFMGITASLVKPGPVRYMQNSKGSQNGQININQKLYVGCRLGQGIQGTGTQQRARLSSSLRLGLSKKIKGNPSAREKINHILKGHGNIWFYRWYDTSQISVHKR